MKRVLLSTILILIGVSSFSQSPSRSICLRPAYPLVIGESTIDGVEFSNNGIYMYDILQDSLPQYEIGEIFAQTVRYSEDGHGFYVKADSLHSLNVIYSYEVNELPQGTIEFNETTGRFKYYPAADDYKSFIVTFIATDGTESVSENVEFNLMPQTLSETSAIQSKGAMPSENDYTLIAETSKTMFLNNEERTAYSISVSGKEVVFDKNDKNKVYGLSGRSDIYELNIYAEKLVIRSALSFPQTNITVYAKQLIFEDNGTEHSSINTTPIPITVLADGSGIDGASAGNITLYIKEFKGNMSKRLILNGAKGQCANRNGTPGNGGNGGIVTSTINLSGYCDFARGSSGVKYDVAPDGSNNEGPVISAGLAGISGRFELENHPYSYLHPYYIAAVMRHATDAFINNHADYALQTCKEYRNIIDEFLNSFSLEYDDITDEGEELHQRVNAEHTERIIELQNDLTEIDNMLFKLEQGLDYFGNPKGWVPLLSFEAYFAAYDNEIDRALPTLYMYYWLSRVDQTLQHMVEASEFAASATENEIVICQNLLNSLVLEIPVLQDQADEVNAMIEILMQRIENLKQQLLARAKRHVKKRNRIKKAVAICQGVANALPILGPVGAGIGGAISTALSNAEVNKFIGKQFGVDYSSAVETVGNVACSEDFFSTIDSTLTEAKASIKDLDLKGLSSAYKSLNKIAGPLITNIKNVNSILSQSSTPDSEVQAEFNRLTAESREWQCLKAQVDSLNIKKTELLNHLNQVFKDMTSTVSELSGNVLALDAFRRDAFTGNSKRDLNAMLYLEKMKQRAKDRLLLYDYYLRKAYEYRLLKPYDGEVFNLGDMYDRFERLGLTLDSVANPTAHEKLGSVFRDRISDMTTRIINEYTYSHPERSSKRTYRIPKEKLDAINENGSVNLNMYEMGFFSPNEENIRIVDFGVKYIKAHSNGDAGYWGELNLEMMHSGISQFRKDGHVYWFNHMSSKTTNPHFWRTKIDVFDLPEVLEPKTDKKSTAISSLFSTILNNNTENIMLFSRPSVWSDIIMSKQVLTDSECDIVIDSLVLELQYDYTRRTMDNHNIDIGTVEDLMPFIACSENDVNGRSGGNGLLYRSYSTSSTPVTFTAIDRYGSYYFKNWTNRTGTVVSEKLDLTVNRMKDQYYRANYERRVPILNVPDTIKVGNSGGAYTVQVGNVGSGVIEMDWYVSDSISSWVHLNGEAEGVDDGQFTFTFDANESNKDRIDSLEIFAPETDIMVKTIYIKQVDDTLVGIQQVENRDENVLIYPIPMKDYVNIEAEGLKSVSLYSIIGNEVASYRCRGNNKLTIPLNAIPNGVYIVTIKTGSGTTSRKVLKVN